MSPYAYENVPSRLLWMGRTCQFCIQAYGSLYESLLAPNFLILAWKHFHMLVCSKITCSMPHKPKYNDLCTGGWHFHRICIQNVCNSDIRSNIFKHLSESFKGNKVPIFIIGEVALAKNLWREPLKDIQSSLSHLKLRCNYVFRIEGVYSCFLYLLWCIPQLGGTTYPVVLGHRWTLWFNLL